MNVKLADYKICVSAGKRRKFSNQTKTFIMSLYIWSFWNWVYSGFDHTDNTTDLKHLTRGWSLFRKFLFLNLSCDLGHKVEQCSWLRGSFNGTSEVKNKLYLPVGTVIPETVAPMWEAVEAAHPEVELGGQWHPSNCTARHRVAIIVPFRDRDEHLRLFLANINPILQRQEISYQIYVIEQVRWGICGSSLLCRHHHHHLHQYHRHGCFRYFLQYFPY